MRYSDITHNDLQDKITEPINIGQIWKRSTKKKFDDAYMNLQACSINSIFQEFESYLGTEVDLVEGDIRLVSIEYSSIFIIYEIPLGIYAFEYLSKVLSSAFYSKPYDSNHSIVIEYDDVSMKAKLAIGSDFMAQRFDEESVFSTILCVTPIWDYKQYFEYKNHIFFGSPFNFKKSLLEMRL